MEYLPRTGEHLHRGSDSRGYQSHFDDLFIGGSSRMAYEGTLQTVIVDLSKMIEDPSTPISKLVIHPPRVIRGVLDAKASEDDNKSKALLVTASTELVKGVYTGSAGKADIDSFSQLVSDTQNEDILLTPVSQKIDKFTWHAMRPHRLAKSAELVLESFPDTDLLFIPLGHGGVAPGIDVFLRVSDLAANTNSLIYPIRFSTRKVGDMYPKVSPEEIEYLRELSTNKEVIVFDEDVSSGRTISTAARFLTEEVFRTKRVNTLVNCFQGKPDLFIPPSRKKSFFSSPLTNRIKATISKLQFA